jgi:predicted nucleotidyltransferase
MVTAEEIIQAVDEIARQFHPERIILFGSCAYGTPTPDSDVDLMVGDEVGEEACGDCIEIAPLHEGAFSDGYSGARRS